MMRMLKRIKERIKDHLMMGTLMAKKGRKPQRRRVEGLQEEGVQEDDELIKYYICFIL